MPRTVRVGIGGPIGCGKTELIEKLVPRLNQLGFKVGVISNDVYSKEDARRLAITLGEKIDPNMILGIETGGCPHTAVRDDPSMNIGAVEKLEKENPDLDLVLIESGGDNITLTFSPRLADFFIYMVDVAGGDKTIRKGGLGLRKADLLIINKIDLAAYVETTIPESDIKTANLDLMMEDAKKIRGDKPTVLVSLKKEVGLDEVVKIIREKALFK
ncbi:MAG TPA: urease accessory protein UreG [candidate division Zixibacteria bacterium]|nr:urease accessory protein UreG [candidate division Zixibacteria bacterium]